MRRFLKAIGRELQSVAFSNAFLDACAVLGTMGFTLVTCILLGILGCTLRIWLVVLVSAVLSVLLYRVLSIIFLFISHWIEWHI